MPKQKLTLAVTGLNNTDNPGPGVPVIRGAKESEDFDIRVIGLVYENLEPGIYMEGICDRIFQIPYPSSGSDELIERIEQIHQQEKIDVLIPNFDAELFSFMKNEQRLLDSGIHTFLPSLKQFQEREKDQLAKYGEKYGVKVPGSINLGSVGQISEMEDKFDYPVMVKGQFYDAYEANNEEQVKQTFHKISAKWGFPVIVQEFVKGTEVNVIALGDGKGNTIAAVPMRKQYITDKGKAWGGITLADEKMMELTRMLIQKTKWKGGMELELIKTFGGEYFLIEINPRIPAWVYLAVGAGQNIPDALIKLALGWDVKPMTEYKIGKMFVRYSSDLIVDLEKFAAISMNKEI
ncbi:MAG: ATP-grasp domain-containing protein [Prolixibacteraceae bacterium]|jgi:carbamoyl-phosphate synthase large subunit|nr:ATP-grasp domain-containing protein [Prolixibacteraceae bacterium]MBT6007074.1 ATP-grasp domain-containing protein [Prolixibacteraceae bacterium]MBT6763130.1 ATP-grasp domain-containing protein [Prolixibacteraceae bacterium]MBT6999232.1 ATP-grasp domain-containing protein [Prolixibacteraceae bacterium]MBT7393285.1 ATP-grasp domain-containing protein [Prolixibacteraceae bacterium]